ncbi:hypothetical protein XENOCAPTIV_023802, partial [Xenoophorus captivus]
VVAAIWDCLVEEFMVVPSTENWRSIAEEFLHRWNFPLCCGAIVLLAVVDAGYRFPVIDVGGMVGPVTAAFWPILPLVRLCVLTHFIYPLTSTCIELGNMGLPRPTLSSFGVSPKPTSSSFGVLTVEVVSVCC